jgi:hypothetical protein
MYIFKYELKIKLKIKINIKNIILLKISHIKQILAPVFKNVYNLLYKT